MAKEVRIVNPFYVLLMIVGVIFTLTASAYFVMSLRMRAPEAADMDETAPLTLVTFLDRHGVTVLLVEVAVLAVLTVLAMATDGFWTRREEARVERDERSSDQAKE